LIIHHVFEVDISDLRNTVAMIIKDFQPCFAELARSCICEFDKIEEQFMEAVNFNEVGSLLDG
jgi:hypothetical protein